MRVRMSLVSLALFCFCVVGYAQNGRTRAKERFVVVPGEIALPTVAYQPDCPLQFENVKLLAGLDGGTLESYNLRNRGNKPIQSITVGDSTGNRWSWDVAKEHGPIMPAQLVPPWSKSDWIELVPLTDELRVKLKLSGGMKGLRVLMVIHAEFTDGTSFDDEVLYNALTAYVESMQNKLDRLEYLEYQNKKSTLRN